MEVKKKLNIWKIILFIFIVVILLFCVAVFGIFTYYNNSLAPVSDSDTYKEVQINKGSSSVEIANILKKFNLIKSEDTFIIYLKINNVNDLKYGVYLFKENMGVEKIVDLLQEGSTYNPDEVTLTIKEGSNMRQIANVISSVTNNSYDDVINKSNDVNYINELRNKYWFISESLLNNDLYYKLEGYLFPDTYSLTNKDVSVEYIFNKMIDEMAKYLEPYRDYDYTSLSIHERLTLASIVEKESSVSSDRSKMASVFLNRKKKGMSLGSDVTARYANKIDEKRALYTNELNYKSLYNTRLLDGSMDGKLPVGPISTISKSSLDASFNPSDGEYLYFISNIETLETFYYEKYNDFLNKKNELASVNRGY